MKTIILTAVALALSAPAAAETVVVNGQRVDAKRIELPRSLTDAEILDLVADKVCEKPYVRNLVGWKLHAQCVAEVRAEATQQLAAARSSEPVVIALR